MLGSEGVLDVWNKAGRYHRKNGRITIADPQMMLTLSFTCPKMIPSPVVPEHNVLAKDSGRVEQEQLQVKSLDV